MNFPTNTVSKKDLKATVNRFGGFVPATISSTETNFPKAAKDKITAKYPKEQAEEILNNAVYIKTVSSNGDLNRNGYIIRENAWKFKGDDGKTAIDRYMENPVILFQHETNEIIGHTFSAKVTKNGLETEGYIFVDQMSEADQKRFERGQLKGISTGHITLAVEWENAETGEVLDAATAEKEIGFWELYFNPLWLMAVTGLDWVEQSLVTIGSNKKSFVTNNADGSITTESNADAKLNFIRNNLGVNVEKFERYVALRADPTQGTKEEFETLENELKSFGKAEPKKVDPNGMVEHILTESDMADETHGNKFATLGLGVGDVVELQPNHPLIVAHMDDGGDEPADTIETPNDAPADVATPDAQDEPSGDENKPSNDEGDNDEVGETPTPDAEPSGNDDEAPETPDVVDEPDADGGTPGSTENDLANASRAQLEQSETVLNQSLLMIRNAMAKQDAANAQDEPEVVETPAEPEAVAPEDDEPIETVSKDEVDQVINGIVEIMEANGLKEAAHELRSNGIHGLVVLFDQLIDTNVQLNNLVENTPAPRRLTFVGETVKQGENHVKVTSKAGDLLKAATRGIRT